MTLERFQRIAQLLGNTTRDRTYLVSFPGQLVLEAANLDGSDLAGLRAGLSNAGFCEVPAPRRGGVEMVRFVVERTDHEGCAASADLSDADVEQRR
ncbi:hypothetical protein GALL_521800 [mine drainage metagenome]|uniref:Uncharacterized protein n=1 Tax=mine drainage metagenome TaxID=410659 RepID=A0A1J5PFE1_9ZZZZ